MIACLSRFQLLQDQDSFESYKKRLMNILLSQKQAWKKG